MADIKPASPRDGELVGPRDAVELARTMVEAGAEGVLVGTAILQAGDPAKFLSRVISGGRV